MVLIGVVFMSILLPGTCFVYCTRALLAWSIDRLVPDKLSKVSERYHSPVNTILVVTVLALVANAIYVFSGAIPTLLSLQMWTVFACTFTFFATVLVGTFFPYFRRKFYEGSAGSVEIAGIPVMTIAGAAATIYIGAMIYFFLTDSYVGTNTPPALALVALSFVTGAIFYYAFRWWRKKQGIDVELAYKEVPIE